MANTPIAIISRMGKFTDFNFGRLTVYMRVKRHYKFGRKGCMGVSRHCSIFWVTPIISETGKATNVKFCMHIHRIDWIIAAKVH